MEALILLAVLACPIVMGTMMLLMWRGMRGHGKDEGTPRDAAPPDEEVTHDGKGGREEVAARSWLTRRRLGMRRRTAPDPARWKLAQQDAMLARLPRSSCARHARPLGAFLHFAGFIPPSEAVVHAP